MKINATIIWSQTTIQLVVQPTVKCSVDMLLSFSKDQNFKKETTKVVLCSTNSGYVSSFSLQLNIVAQRWWSYKVLTKNSTTTSLIFAGYKILTFGKRVIWHRCLICVFVICLNFFQLIQYISYLFTI